MWNVSSSRDVKVLSIGMKVLLFDVSISNIDVKGIREFYLLELVPI